MQQSMIQSVPNMWYNIDELYTISNHGTIELSTLENKDKMSGTTSTESYQRNLCTRITTQHNDAHQNKKTLLQRVISRTKMDFLWHVLDTKRSIYERTIWSILIFIILLVAVLLGICVLKNSRTSLSESYIPVSQLYFPAVTVCPENKIYKQSSRKNSRLTNFSTFEYTNKFEESELRRMLCDSPQDLDEMTTPTHQGTSQSANDNLMMKALRLSPKLTNFLESCKFGTEDCFNEFEKTVTEEGLCYTFNGFNIRDLYNHDLELPMQEDIVQTADGEKSFRYMIAGAIMPFTISESVSGMEESHRVQLTSNPRRAASHLQHLTLDLFTINEYADDSCRANAGFKIFIHDPETPPHSATAAVVDVAMDSEVTIAVSPTLYSAASAAAAGPDVDAYRCHRWHHNQNLTLFQFYSKRNCEFDSIAQHLEHCVGCVPFFIPRKVDSLLCNSTNLPRLRQCVEQISSSDIFEECIPGCEHVSYSISSSEKYYRWTVNHKVRTFTAMSRVRIRFNDSHAVLKKWTMDSLNGEACAIVLFVLIIACAHFGITAVTIAELLYTCLSSLCRKEKTPTNGGTKNEMLPDDVIAESDVGKNAFSESPTFSDELKMGTFSGRDAY